MKSSQNTWNRCGKLCSSPSNCIVISIQFTQSSLRSFAHLSWSLIDNSQFHFSLCHFIFAKCAHFSMEKLMNIAVYLTHACHSIHLFIFFFFQHREHTLKFITLIRISSDHDSSISCMFMSLCQFNGERMKRSQCVGDVDDWFSWAVLYVSSFFFCFLHSSFWCFVFTLFFADTAKVFRIKCIMVVAFYTLFSITRSSFMHKYRGGVCVCVCVCMSVVERLFIDILFDATHCIIIKNLCVLR